MIFIVTVRHLARSFPASPVRCAFLILTPASARIPEIQGTRLKLAFRRTALATISAKPLLTRLEKRSA